MDSPPARPAPLEQEPESGAGWQRDKQDREYIPARGRKGIIYRKGEESVQEALTRDEKRDQRPRKSKTAKKPPPPQKVDLRELEAILAEGLRSPAMMCAAFGDQWAADHFTNQGPLLARNLVAAAEHNQWLRKKLESYASGGDMMMNVLAMVGVGGALVGYAVPPVVYWLNLPVPDKAREMFGIPPRREPQPDQPDHASGAPAQPFAAAA